MNDRSDSPSPAPDPLPAGMAPPSRPAELQPFPVVIQLPVLWGNMDAFGHVNNTVPIRWFESARIVYLQQCGLEHLMTAEELGPILASITCNYRRQMHYPAHVLIGARVSKLGRTSMTMDHLVYNLTQQEVAAEGHSVIVVFDYQSQRPTRIPDDLREQIERFESEHKGD